ncbi:MAG TPA: CSLREA domain-containing protein [Thermoanaerobaculia bacterium]
MTHLRCITLLATILTVAAGAIPAGATILQVTKTADTNDGACDSDCSLREAIVAANAHPGADVILLPAGIYNLAIAGAGDSSAATGDLDIVGELTILGAGATSTIIDARFLDRVFDIPAGSTLDMTGVTIRGGLVPGSGGGIRNHGTLTLARVVVSGNTASSGGLGGGIFSDGALDLRDSTVNGNHADQGGGGIAADTSLTLANVTVSGNQAGHFGGGLYLFADLQSTIANATITGNSAGEGGGAFVEQSAFIGTTFNDFHNTILAGNTATTHPDCSGTPFSGGYNILGVGDQCFDLKAATHDKVGTFAAPLDPKLSTLSDNGGPTPTFALLTGSPAIGGGNPAAPGSTTEACELRDQRGVARPGGTVCDVGAFEQTTACATGGGNLCLNNDRFRVTVAWHTPDGKSGSGQAVPLTGDTGYFWFFNPANVEITIKALNGCGLGGHYWVFLSGLTNVAATITVTDTVSGQTKTYTNAQGKTFQTVLDTGAFATCP